MARGLWGALKRLGRGRAAQPEPKKDEERPVLKARKTTTASGRPHLVVRKASTAKRARAKVSSDAPKGSEKVKAVRMRTKSPRVVPTTTKRALAKRRRALAKGGLEIIGRREEAVTAMRESFRDLGTSLRDIHSALRDDQARSQAVAEKLHQVPAILSALPAIAERQQACLDRMADRTEALSVIPKALAAVHDHAKAQIATLVAIREHLEHRAQREEQLVDEMRGLGDGQRALVDGVKDLGEVTAAQMQRQQDELWTRVNERDRQRRNRLLAVAAGLGLGLASLGAVAAHAGASTIRGMQRSSQLLADTATRDMDKVRGELQAVGELERRIAEREDELRLLLTAARGELARSRQQNQLAIAEREAELERLRSELATRQGPTKEVRDSKAPSAPETPGPTSTPTVRD